MGYKTLRKTHYMIRQFDIKIPKTIPISAFPLYTSLIMPVQVPSAFNAPHCPSAGFLKVYVKLNSSCKYLLFCNFSSYFIFSCLLLEKSTKGLPKTHPQIRSFRRCFQMPILCKENLLMHVSQNEFP